MYSVTRKRKVFYLLNNPLSSKTTLGISIIVNSNKEKQKRDFLYFLISSNQKTAVNFLKKKYNKIEKKSELTLLISSKPDDNF